MTTYNTKNPLGSSAAKDLYDNAQNFDHLSLDQTNKTWPDRLGRGRLTWYGMEENIKAAIMSLGWNPVGTFQDGATAANPVDIIQDTTDYTWYRWDDLSTLPKTVLPDSTPGSTGGTGDGKWQPVDISDVLRRDLADENSTVSIAGVPAAQVGNNVTSTKYLEAPNVYDLVVAYGQSNALGLAGSSGDTTGYPTPSSKSLMFDTADGTIKLITQNMGSTSGETSTGHAWCAFANEWYRISGRGAVVINAAKGSQPLANLLKSSPSGLYSLMQTGVSNAKSRMVAQGLTLGNVYVIFHQGETDQQLLTPFDTYSFDLTTLIDTLATDLSMKRFSNCTVGCPDNREEYTWSTIQNAQNYTVNRRQNAVTVFDGCPSFLLSDGNIGAEGVHYTQQGYNTMGTGAARGLWSVENGSARTKSIPDLADYAHGIAPWARAKQCFASSQYSNGSASWVVLNKSNGDTFLRPANINSVSVAADGNSLLFAVADNARLWFSFNGDISRNGDSIGLSVAVDRVSVGAVFNLRAVIYIDLELVINISTGAVTSPRGGVASAWLQSLVSVTVSAGTAVVTHGSTLNLAQVSHYAGTTLADANATVSVNCPSNTQTRVYLANAPTNPTVVISLKRVLVTPAQLQTLGGTQIFVRGVYAPDV